MDRSENHWPVLARAQLHWFTAAGQRFAAANADVAYLAAYLINQFNATVETLAGPVLDDWSWASRPVREQVSGFSNHASACAWDLNATKHPRGVHGTFTAEQIAAVRKILAKITDDAGNHVFRWGNDYKNSPVDAMHFEINLNPLQVAQAARKLRASLADEPDSKPQEDKVTPAEIQAIANAVVSGLRPVIHAEVLAVLAHEPFIPNQKLKPTDAPAANFTTGGVLSNIELNQDQQTTADAGDRVLLAEIHAVASGQITRDAEQVARLDGLGTRLEEKFDALLTLLSTKATG